MGVSIKASQLSSEMKAMLEEYQTEVSEAVIEALKETADEATQELHTAGTFSGTKYRSSWTNEIQKKKFYSDAVVYNKKHYQLTHLLEFGHAKQNGGRTREFPHIAPVNEKVGDIFAKKLEGILK